MTTFSGFPADTFAFLEDLSANNNREWFNANKARYEFSCLAPALAFIEACQKPLQRAAPLLKVEAKRMGGSLMRIYKDTRFSKDKTPYKTNIGIQFRHQAGKDVHAPGVYIHIAADECFLGAGMWRPDGEAVKQIREFIDENGQQWQRLLRAKRFVEAYELYDDRLKSAPRGYDKTHPLIDQLRLKSFLGTSPLKREHIQSGDLVDLVVRRTKAAGPLMQALCEAVGQPY